VTLVQYTCEGTDGTTASATALGANQVSAAPGTVKYSAAMAENGTTGIEVQSATNVVAVVRFLANAPSTTMAFEGAFTTPVTAPASGVVRLMTLRYATGVACYVEYTSAGAIRIADTTGANPVTVISSVTTSTRYRLAIVAVVGAATVAPFDGQITANIYASGGSTTPLNGSPATSSTFNLNVNPIVGGDFGVINALVATFKVGWDSIQFNDGSNSEIGPLATPTLAFASWTTTTNWTLVGGGTVAANLSDNNDSTGIISLTNPTAQVLEGTLPPILRPGSGQPLVCPFRGFRSSSTSGSITAKLYLSPGGTLKSTVTGISVPTSVGAISVSFPSTDLTTITDAQFAAGLTVRLECTAA
jgi:hypothetical protein